MMATLIIYFEMPKKKKLSPQEFEEKREKYIKTIAESLAGIVRFSLDDDFRSKCYTLMEVNNTNSFEESVRKKLEELSLSDSGRQHSAKRRKQESRSGESSSSRCPATTSNSQDLTEACAESSQVDEGNLSCYSPVGSDDSQPNNKLSSDAQSALLKNQPAQDCNSIYNTNAVLLGSSQSGLNGKACLQKEENNIQKSSFFQSSKSGCIAMGLSQPENEGRDSIPCFEVEDFWNQDWYMANQQKQMPRRENTLTRNSFTKDYGNLISTKLTTPFQEYNHTSMAVFQKNHLWKHDRHLIEAHNNDYTFKAFLKLVFTSEDGVVDTPYKGKDDMNVCSSRFSKEVASRNSFAKLPMTLPYTENLRQQFGNQRNQNSSSACFINKHNILTVHSSSNKDRPFSAPCFQVEDLWKHEDHLDDLSSGGKHEEDVNNLPGLSQAGMTCPEKKPRIHRKYPKHFLDTGVCNKSQLSSQDEAERIASLQIERRNQIDNNSYYSSKFVNSMEAFDKLPRTLQERGGVINIKHLDELWQQDKMSSYSFIPDDSKIGLNELPEQSQEMTKACVQKGDLRQQPKRSHHYSLDDDFKLGVIKMPRSSHDCQKQSVNTQIDYEAKENKYSGKPFIPTNKTTLVSPKSSNPSQDGLHESFLEVKEWRTQSRIKRAFEESRPLKGTKLPSLLENRIEDCANEHSSRQRGEMKKNINQSQYQTSNPENSTPVFSKLPSFSQSQSIPCRLQTKKHIEDTLSANCSKTPSPNKDLVCNSRSSDKEAIRVSSSLNISKKSVKRMNGSNNINKSSLQIMFAEQAYARKAELKERPLSAEAFPEVRALNTTANQLQKRNEAAEILKSDIYWTQDFNKLQESTVENVVKKKRLESQITAEDIEW